MRSNSRRDPALTMWATYLLAVTAAGFTGRLTGDNWNSKAQGDKWGVVFYTDGSEGSLKSATYWDRIMDEYGELDHVMLGKVDCVAERALCDHSGVNEFPALRFGNPHMMKGAKGMHVYRNKFEYENLERFVGSYVERMGEIKKRKLEGKYKPPHPEHGHVEM